MEPGNWKSPMFNHLGTQLSFFFFFTTVIFKSVQLTLERHE